MEDRRRRYESLTGKKHGRCLQVASAIVGGLAGQAGTTGTYMTYSHVEMPKVVLLIL